ncbi:hypothetical protein P0082_10020 [Candidatus Haliotispira prima]|uniref:N-acetyltransferase domain-containing protein n=1 Tax=Candidatus Haliotispira prima TaxID=3034016 RepID=A0ABY8MFP8_9SPIO|nr:hypothetical protein P0082_10020 [Candidatus Haliotispira prima]
MSSGKKTVVFRPARRVSKASAEGSSSAMSETKDRGRAPVRKSGLPVMPTALRIWQHSRLIRLSELGEDLQDRVLILRNHPDVCAMSHNRNLISYAAHQDYLRELQRHRPKFDCCVLFCDAISLLQENTLFDKYLDARVKDAAGSLKVLRPIIGVVSIDMRIAGRPLLGLYKNLYHYPHIRLGRALLFAAMLRAGDLGLREIFMECYSRNGALQKLARQLGFLPESAADRTRRGSPSLSPDRDERGQLLCYQRYLPSSRNLLQDPLFADFAELRRESASLEVPSGVLGRLR